MRSVEFLDKSSWLRGPWHQEPDRVWWICKESNYSCVADRNAFGAWCGFVGLDHEHPLYEVDHAKAEGLHFIEVHDGDISFSGWNEELDIYFTPSIRRYYFGFDCMREFDICPAFNDEVIAARKLKKYYRKDYQLTYRTLDYVVDQITLLATQLQFFDERFFNNIDDYLNSEEDDEGF